MRQADVISWVRRRVAEFLRREDGTATIESLIWIQFMFVFILLTLNVTEVSVAQARALRVVQDANRSYVIGRLTSETAVRDFITERMATISPRATVSTRVTAAAGTTPGLIVTSVSLPMSDLIRVSLIAKAFQGRFVVATAQQATES